MTEVDPYQYRIYKNLAGELDRLQGRCSGLPECCISYFVDVWIGQGVFRTEAGQAYRLEDRPSSGYLRCPDCRRHGIRAEVRKCTAQTCFCGLARPMMYRLEDVQYSALPDPETGEVFGTGTLRVELRVYPVLRTTPRGTWIEGPDGPRFVLAQARKHFACPDIVSAHASFLARKRKQRKIHLAAVHRVERAIALAGETPVRRDGDTSIGWPSDAVAQPREVQVA